MFERGGREEGIMLEGGREDKEVGRGEEGGKRECVNFLKCPFVISYLFVH